MAVIEQLALVPPLPTHHRPVLRRRSRQQTESPFGATLNAFIDSIDPKQTSSSGTTCGLAGSTAARTGYDGSLLIGGRYTFGLD